MSCMMALDDVNNGGVFKWNNTFFVKTFEKNRDKFGNILQDDHGYVVYLRLSDNQVLPAIGDWDQIPECWEDVEYFGNIDSLLVGSLPGLSDKATRDEVALDTLHTIRYQIVNGTRDINPEVSNAYMRCVKVIDKMIDKMIEEDRY